MATILFQATGAALGGIFGPAGAMIGRAVGGLAGSVVDRAIINGMTTIPGRPLSDARIPGAEEGTSITRAYGTVRVGGTLIWATRFEEDVRRERRGGKSTGPRVETFHYFANFALGICEGEIAGVRRVWADGRELDLSGVEMRLYRGTENQAPDPLIEAKQGTGNAPAFRGLAYAVFDRLPLEGYGNRIPVIQFEVIRPVGTLENGIRAVTIIPGSSEHGYNPAVVTEETGPGASRAINRNVFHVGSDWQGSIDELQALCPNLERVALVVAWFGTDLRAGECRIRPGVEVVSRQNESRPWSVSGIARDGAHLISRRNGAPAYGGTPDDAGVVAAIDDLKARGLEVYLYPFVMMDVPEINGLSNPYGGSGQPPYPWRGRITCHPAPGEPGTADRTAAAATQIAAFTGAALTGHFSISGTSVVSAAPDEGYRRLVLHYAHLAKAAGGVSGFIIGSEMRGLTCVRDGTGAFPFVGDLQVLAGEVRAILGAATKLTYGADWSEYFGYHPQDGSGEVHYNLDPLWASPAIDAIGIDNYMPLSDWRDGDAEGGNPDGFALCEDAAAMRAMVTGGEGFDWFYASQSDRQQRLRTPITDGLAGKPWVYRYKDLSAWWSNPHFNRTGGGELETPTAWVPGSKPIWFTELGCPAIDKGANQPNVFVDPKSAESALPYFSSGNRNDAVQRRFLDAHLAHWTGPDTPPGMVDPGHIFLWTWDARPVPAFPQNTGLFADGDNWQTGHWLNGRLGAGTLADILTAILADHGFEGADTALVSGDLMGFVQAEQASARQMLEPLLAAFQVDALEEGATLRFRSRMMLSAAAETVSVLADPDEGGLIEEVRAHESEFASEAILDHFEADASYQKTTARSRRLLPGNERVLRLSVPGPVHEQAAGGSVEQGLRDHRAARRTVRFHLPPNDIALQPGDRITFEEGPSGTFLVSRIEEGAMRSIEARSFVAASGGTGRTAAPRPPGGKDPAEGFSPVLHLMDLPRFEPGEAAGFARAAAFLNPWRPMVLSSSATTEGYRARAALTQPARMGRLAAPLGPGVSGRFDHRHALVLDLYFGGLSSADAISVLNGANRLAVSSLAGGWEILSFRTAEEVAAGRFRLTGLLRGLAGTEDQMQAGAAIDAPAVLLDAAAVPMGIAAEEAGQTANWIAEVAGGAHSAFGPVTFAGGLRASTPLSPVHLRARRLAGGDIRLTWIRRGRVDADHWLGGDIPLDEPVEAYRADILAGGTAVRSVEVSEPAHTYTADEQTADFGGPVANLTFRVFHKGGKVPLGLPAVLSVTL